jgi:NADPH:quinone reductase-like Zn-dependent oxidoreductase
MLIDERTPLVTRRMRAVRLHAPQTPEAVQLEEIEMPQPQEGEALVRVYAAAITRDELTWPVDRLPAIPSYELSGVVAEVGAGVEGLSAGDAVYALTPFDRDGVAAEYAAVPVSLLAPKPATLSHVECAAVPLAALSAWQALFDRGGLESSERVLIHGAAGGVGHFAVQLARWRGAHVIGTASPAGMAIARESGAHEVVDRTRLRFEEAIDPVDLIFDTVGGELLARSPAIVGPDGRIVSVAEQPPAGIDAVYFVVEPNREQLIELARLIEAGQLRPAIDSVFPLADAKSAFERVEARGKRGKVVLKVADD